jgi:hypothetical protein
MTRTALWAPAVLILTFAVVPAPAAASCNSEASKCLGTCADIDQRIRGSAPYNRCVLNCDKQLNSCRLFETRK